MNASDVLVERLMDWGVDTIFGLPGDGINGVFEALRKNKDRIRFIHVRHEESAARMGSSPDSSVVDKFGRTHDIANLFICDGSILPTQGSANPGLTIQALAARTADYLIEQGGESVFFSNRRAMQEPRIRYDLSPPYTNFKSNPRLA